jgi:hypothetical protein
MATTRSEVTVIGCLASDGSAQTPPNSLGFGVDRVFGHYGSTTRWPDHLDSRDAPRCGAEWGVAGDHGGIERLGEG